MNGPSKVSSGTTTPKIAEPQIGSNELLLFTGVGICLGGVLLAAWYFGQSSVGPMMTPAATRVEYSAPPEIIKQPGVFNHAGAFITKPSPLSMPVVTLPDKVIHEDLYFEAGRKGLTVEAQTTIATRAEFLRQHEGYGVLIQGYTDQQGSAAYNKTLGMNRAETVKGELVRAGIAEHRIAAVSLGEEGVLCVDNSEICRHLNRRVHLEIHNIGQEHMAIPAVAATAPDRDASEDNRMPDEETGPIEAEDLQPLDSEPGLGS